MAVHGLGAASVMSVVGAVSLGAVATELIGPFGGRTNACIEAAAKAGRAEDLPLVDRGPLVVNRARKSDRLNMHSAAPEPVVPWKERWPDELRPSRSVPAIRERKGKLMINCELPFAAYLASGDVEPTPGRCVTDLRRPDWTVS